MSKSPLYLQCLDLQDALIQYRDKHEYNEEKVSAFLYNRISHLVDVLKDTIPELKESEEMGKNNV